MLIAPAAAATTTWPPAAPQWTSQRPNRPPISRPTPEITLWIMSPTPDPDDAVEDSSSLAPSLEAAGLSGLGAPAVES